MDMHGMCVYSQPQNGPSPRNCRANRGKVEQGMTLKSPTTGTDRQGLSGESLPALGQGLPPTGGGRLVTIRSMAISCALMPILALWVVQSELIWYSGHSTAISLFYHVTFVVFLLSLANLAVRKKWPGAALSPVELLTIYMMLSIAGTFCSHDLLQVMVPMLSFPFYNANPQNRWDEYITPYLSGWSVITDREAALGMAVGNSSLYDPRNLAAWIRPLGFWMAFLMALMGALLSINVFFRQPWTEKERLAFPVIQIPLMLCAELPRLLRNKLFWLAFAITASIDILNGFNYFFPNLPSIPIVEAFHFREYLVERPWNAIGGITINLYPFVIGLSFFLPLDLAFSCWFFYLFYKFQLVLTNALGIQDLPGFPFQNEQAAGGYLALGIIAIWLSRRHFAGVLRRVFGLAHGADDSQEPLSYRASFVILMLCLAFLVFAGMKLGGSWPVMLAFFLIFFLYSIAIARIRAELGPPAHDLHNMGPDILIHNALGDRVLGKGNIAALSLFFWFNRAYRAHFSAHSMEGFKIAQLHKILARSMMVAMVVAIVVGAIAAFWAILSALYVHGYSGRNAGDAFSSEAWNRMAAWVSMPHSPRVPAAAATGIGMIFALFLGAMRMRFTWWAWHPVGYATSSSWSMEKLWFCIMAAWAAKLLITRYGGSVAYRKALPFFVGLVMGEFTVGGLWGIYGSMMGTPVYHFWG